MARGQSNNQGLLFGTKTPVSFTRAKAIIVFSSKGLVPLDKEPLVGQGVVLKLDDALINHWRFVHGEHADIDKLESMMLSGTEAIEARIMRTNSTTENRYSAFEMWVKNDQLKLKLHCLEEYRAVCQRVS